MRLFRGIRMSWLQGDFPLRWWWFIATPHLVIGKWRKPGARPGREENSCSSGHLWPSWLNRRGLILCCLLQKSGAGLSSSPEAEGTRGEAACPQPLTCPLGSWSDPSCVEVVLMACMSYAVSAWEQNAGNTYSPFERLYLKHYRVKNLASVKWPNNLGVQAGLLRG